jgi:endonuclease/exonuclease/phosphatase family metal-dependent hydrolase
MRGGIGGCVRWLHARASWYARSRFPQHNVDSFGIARSSRAERKLNIISWNIRHSPAVWTNVAASGADVALLQEACEPPASMMSRVDVEPDAWKTEGAAGRHWRTSVVGLRAGLRIRRLSTKSLVEAVPGELATSRAGSFAAAIVDVPSSGERITLISMYSVWENRHLEVGGDNIFADASAHRLISDISSLVTKQRGHRIIAAGDLNCLYGYGEEGRRYWRDRYETIFERFRALGVPFIGPQAPHGRQAQPWPTELPPESLNVPTYYTSRQKSPENATRQLDFVFASAGLAPRLEVRALNELAEWGPSDHCRIAITLRDA